VLVLPSLNNAAHCAEIPGNNSPKLKPIALFPALITTAKLNRIPIEGLDAASGTNRLRPGDSATVLITFVQKKKQTQWLLYLEAAVPTPAEATNKTSSFVVKSAFGPPEKFRSRPAPLTLRMFGPFVAIGSTRPKQETDARFSVNEDFLALGLDKSAALLSRWSKATNFNKAVTSKALLAMNPTPAEQRAMAATFPALFSYFDIVQHTEGLEDLLRKLIELPSLWSVIKRRGVTMNLTFGNDFFPFAADPKDWNSLTVTPVYYFPWLLQLNGEPALKITLVVTDPQRPLLICGGVVSVLVEKIGDEQTYMTMRVISAKSRTEHQD